MAKKENKSSASERGFYVSGRVKLDKADKAKFMAQKKKLSTEAKFTLTDAQVVEYMIRSYLSSFKG